MLSIPHPAHEERLWLASPPSALPSHRAKSLLFRDPASLRLLEQIERIAPTEATVLIRGETGTGKELVARHLHRHSGRKGPFVAVNCGAFSDTLIDAELFGHESGAFTGASQARAGWFEAANGGTLFLDEIGDMPLAMQVKLLRVLQERQVVRIGSRRPIPIDVRLVAASNVDLRRAVQARSFRADLYYRLHVAPVLLPPLRERSGDILPLARLFMAQYAERLGQEPATIDPEAQAALLAHHWPGNIRELENVIHFALIVCRHDIIRAADLRLAHAGLDDEDGPLEPAADPHAGLGHAATDGLPAEPAFGARAHADRFGSGIPPGLAARDPQETLVQLVEQWLDSGMPRVFAHVERSVVQTAFARADHNQVRAARALGVSRNTLRTLLKRHGLMQGESDSPAAAEAQADDEAEAVDSALPVDPDEAIAPLPQRDS